MSFFWKIVVLFGVWVVFGFVAIGINSITWFYRISRDVAFPAGNTEDDTINEILNTSTFGLYGFESQDSVSDCADKIEKRTREPIWKGLLESSIKWPSTIAITNTRFQETYDEMKEKYGSQKSLS